MAISPNLTLESVKDKHIYISIWLHGRGWTPAGTVTYNEGLGYAGFSYFESYIKADLPPLNPATLNHRDGDTRHFVVDSTNNAQMLDRTFWELLPTQGDFGHQALVSRFPQYQSLNNAQKLYFLGNRIVGGLASHVKEMKEEGSVDSVSWLDSVRHEAVAFHLRELSKINQHGAFQAMTSYGGVRPKAMYKDGNGKFWIAKFNLPSDPYDMAIAEHVAILMAKDCGLRVPQTSVLRLPSGENVFLTERFDRRGDERLHSLALYSLAPGIDAERRAPNGGLKPNNAAVLAAIIRRYSDFQNRDTAGLVARMLVDIGFNNTDNHLRNTRLLLNKNGKWELSPVFDVLFNPRSQPHIYNPSGLNLEDNHLSNPELSSAISSLTGAAVEAVEDAKNGVIAVSKDWERYCDDAGMSGEDKIKVKSALALGMNRSELKFQIEKERRVKLESLLKKTPKPSF